MDTDRRLIFFKVNKNIRGRRLILVFIFYLITMYLTKRLSTIRSTRLVAPRARHFALCTLKVK
jgi:hypothetical protein